MIKTKKGTAISGRLLILVGTAHHIPTMVANEIGLIVLLLPPWMTSRRKVCCYRVAQGRTW